MATSNPKISMSFIVMFMMILIASKVSADIDEDGTHSLLGESRYSTMSKANYKMGPPLYRVRSKPNFFVPASKLDDDDAKPHKQED